MGEQISNVPLFIQLLKEDIEKEYNRLRIQKEILDSVSGEITDNRDWYDKTTESYNEMQELKEHILHIVKCFRKETGIPLTELHYNAEDESVSITIGNIHNMHYKIEDFQ